MTNEIKDEAKGMARLRALQAALAHVPDAARHQKVEAETLAEAIEADCQADTLPPRTKALWQTHRVTINQALTAAATFADDWDAQYPIVAAELTG